MKQFAVILISAFVLSSVQAAHVHQPKSRPQNAEGFSLASNRFGLDLLTQIGQQNDQQQQRKNIFFSPYSIAVALSMVHQGAQGRSAEQLRTTLRFVEDDVQLNGGDQQTVGQSLHHVQERLQQQQDPSYYQYDSGNVIVVDKQFRVKDDYVKSVRDIYDGEVITADYQHDQEGVKKTINQYVAKKTHGMIDPMLEQAPSKDSRLALINAVYFKGQWAKRFDPEDTETGVFYGDNGQQYQGVKYMKASGYYPYTELHGLDAHMVMVPYKGEEVSFIGVLPRSRDGDLSQIRKQLNASYIDQMIGQMNRYQQPQVIIPKMEVQTTYDLPQTLQAMGIQDVFGDSADLSGISDEKIRVGQTIHKAKIVVSEEGTEAGAGTYIQIAVMALPVDPPTFRFDHPYLYFIRHHATGQILFIGEVHQF